MPTPVISVIITVYNTALTLPRCVDSVLAQTFADYEIVLVDDGSTDGAGDIVDRYARQHRCVIALHQANAGQAEARRAGVGAATGQFVVHLDSDDTLPPDALRTLYDRVAAHGLDMAFGCYERIVGDRHFVVEHHETGFYDADGLLMHMLDRRNICTSGANISRRSLWAEDIYPPGGMRLPAEDTLMLLMLSQHVGRAGLFNDVVYNYYYTPGSSSVGGALHLQHLWLQFFELLRQHLRERHVLESTEQLVRIMEVERLAFSTRDQDRQGQWYRQVMAYRWRDFSARQRLLLTLLRWPPLLRAAIAMRRSFRRWMH